MDLPWPLLSHPHSVRLPANIIIKSLYNLNDYLVVFKNSLSDEIFNYKLQPPLPEAQDLAMVWTTPAEVTAYRKAVSLEPGMERGD